MAECALPRHCATMPGVVSFGSTVVVSSLSRQTLATASWRACALQSAAVTTLGMGLLANYPFALAPGMGLNAVVAFELVAGRGLTWPQAMTVVVLEGLVITVLVLTRFRQARISNFTGRASGSISAVALT